MEKREHINEQRGRDSGWKSWCKETKMRNSSGVICDSQIVSDFSSTTIQLQATLDRNLRLWKCTGRKSSTTERIEWKRKTGEKVSYWIFEKRKNRSNSSQGKPFYSSTGPNLFESSGWNLKQGNADYTRTLWEGSSKKRESNIKSSSGTPINSDFVKSVFLKSNNDKTSNSKGRGF